jgi:hypothetical protein
MKHNTKQVNDLNIITNISLKKLNNKYESKAYNNLYLDTAAKFLVHTPIDELEKVASLHSIDDLPISSRKPFMELFNFNSLAFREAIGEVWDNAFETGIKHHIADLLFNDSSFRKLFEENNQDKTANGIKFGYIGKTNIAEFISKREKAKQNKARADKARATRTINLINKYDNLGLFERLRLTRSTYIANRMNVQQRKSFLQTIKLIVNDAKKAEALKKNYLASNYIKQRKAVLGIEYARKYDKQVKKNIKNFLSKDITSVKAVRSSGSNTDKLISDVKAALVKKPGFREDPDYIKNLNAKKIVRTELVLAYNFGKLAAYNSPQDLDRLLEWNADFELEYLMPGYKVCTACKKMNGKRFTVRHLLEIGSLTDAGILSYNGKNKIRWKDPNFPVIPYHFNCCCKWINVKENTNKHTSTTSNTTTRSERQPINKLVIGSSNNIKTNKDLEKEIDSIKEGNDQIDSIEKAIDTAINLTGLGLIVTGGFLLARSNAFKSFIKEVDKTGSEILKDSSKLKNIIQTEEVEVSNKTIENIKNIYKPATEEYKAIPKKIPDEVSKSNIKELDKDLINIDTISNELPGYDRKLYRYSTDYVERVKKEEISKIIPTEYKTIKETLDGIASKEIPKDVLKDISKPNETISKIEEKVFKLDNGNVLTKQDINNLEKIIDVLEEGQKTIDKLPDKEYLKTYNELVAELAV